MSKLKNHYGENVAWFCADAAITLEDMRDIESGAIDDAVEVYGEDENGNEGSVEVCIITLLESASVSLNEKDARIKNLENAISGLLNIAEDSGGVTGYHLNGDIAEWEEFEEIAIAKELIGEQQCTKKHK